MHLAYSVLVDRNVIRVAYVSVILGPKETREIWREFLQLFDYLFNCCWVHGIWWSICLLICDSIMVIVDVAQALCVSMQHEIFKFNWKQVWFMDGYRRNEP